MCDFISVGFKKKLQKLNNNYNQIIKKKKIVCF